MKREEALNLITNLQQKECTKLLEDTINLIYNDFELKEKEFRKLSTDLLLMFSEQSTENNKVASELYHFINNNSFYQLGGVMCMTFDMDKVNDIFYRRNELIKGKEDE